MQVLAFNPKEIPKGQDYLFESYNDFERLKDYLKYPKIGLSTWKICFVDISIKDARLVAQTDMPEFVEIILCLKKDVLIRFLQENNKLREEKKSRWESFLDIISTFPIMIEQKAASEIFKRTSGSREKIEEILEDLKTMFFDVACIQVSHVNAVSIREDKVYARDVILSLLLQDNDNVPKRGHILSGYKYKNWRKLYSQLCKEIGEEIAFYSLRKATARLYNSKVKYLSNEQVTTDAAVMDVIDVYELMHAHIAFSTANKKQSEVVLRIIEGRKHNAGLFERTVLSYLD